MNSVEIPEISVVILCYRSGDYARIFHKRVVNILNEAKLDYEIILVGNWRRGTEDNTPLIVKEIATSNPRTKIVVKEKTSPEQAMSWDMRSGLEISTGKTVTVIDGDGQIPPEDIPRLYKTLKNNNLDLCKGKRITRGDGFYRKFISRTFNFIMQILFPGIADDINGKPKLFTREVLDKLKLESNGWFIDAEIMIKARKYGLRVGEIETVFLENPERQSFISFKANLEFIKNIIYWRLREWGVI